MQVSAADMRHFKQVLERIAGEPYVERTKSVLVLLAAAQALLSVLPGLAGGGLPGAEGLS